MPSLVLAVTIKKDLSTRGDPRTSDCRACVSCVFWITIVGLPPPPRIGLTLYGSIVRPPSRRLPYIFCFNIASGYSEGLGFWGGPKEIPRGESIPRLDQFVAQTYHTNVRGRCYSRNLHTHVIPMQTHAAAQRVGLVAW